LILVAGILLTGLGTYSAYESVQAKSLARRAEEQRIFEQDTAEIQSKIEARVEACIALLRGAKALFVVNPATTRSEFGQFVQRLEVTTRYPGIQGIGFTKRLRPEEAPSFIKNVRQELPSFNIWPSDRRDEYHTIVFLEPLDRRNEAALGYDMFTQPTRRAAMERARDNGGPALTGPVTLVQEIDEEKQQGFLIYVPIYEGGVTPASIEQRRELLLGFAYSPFRAADFVHGISLSERLKEIDFQLIAADGTVLRGFRFTKDMSEAFTDDSEFEVAGNKWKLLFRGSKSTSLPVSMAIVPTVAVAGGLVTSLLYLLARRQARERERINTHREWLRVTLSSIGDGVIATDLHGHITFMNPVAESLTGWPFRDVEGKPVEQVFNVINEETKQQVAIPVHEVIQKGVVVGLTNHTALRTRSGKEIPIEDSAAPIKDAVGATIGAVLVFHDVEQKRSAEKADRERAELIAAQNVIGSAILGELDTKTLLQLITDEAVKLSHAAFGAFFYNVLSEHGESYMLYTLSGAPREKFENFPMPRATALFGPTFRGEGIIRSDDITKDPRYGKQQEGPFRGMPPGHLPVKSYLAVPVKSRSNNVIGGLFLGHSEVGVFSKRDEQIASAIAAQASIAIENARLYESAQKEIEARKHAEEQRLDLLKKEQEARSRAEAASRAKDEFIAVVSHELRTPLTPMLGWVRMLKLSGLDNAQHRHGLDVIERNVKAQIRLVEDLLDMNRLLSGKLKIENRVLNLDEVVSASVETMKAVADSKHIAIHVRNLAESRVQVYGDFVRLQQVHCNLLSNAIKFTSESGAVSITTSISGQNAEVCVEDNGQGIDPEFLPHLFQRFTQADSSTTRQYGGLGLGLAIAKQIIELHGGSIFAKSRGKAKGAQFYVHLPLYSTDVLSRASDSRGTPSRDLEEILQNVKVLVVDDAADTREFLSVMLKQWKVRTETAADTSEAMNVYNRFSPDVLVTDIGMPGDDGYALLRSLKEKYGDNAVRAIALSAHARPEDRARSQKEGFQLHLAKPIEPMELVKAIAMVLQTHPENSQ